MDDREISAMLAERSEEALDALNEKYGRLCLQIAGNILADPRDVEECVNDSLLAVWNHFPSDRPEQLAAYVCKTVRNLSLNRLEFNRAAKREAGEPLALEECEEIFPDESIRADGGDRELTEIINRYLKAQSPERAAIFIRRYFFCDSIKTIAKNHRYSEAKVRNLLARMRAGLKGILMKEGYYDEE